MRLRRRQGGHAHPIGTLVLGLWLIAAVLAGCAPWGATASPSGASAAAQTASSPVASPTPDPTGPSVDPLSGLPIVAAADLPREARTILGKIAAGGPYAYSQDGVVFQNREGVLPRRASGYYHEYTVPTPGSADRGTRRIVTGGAGEQYYTDDHYASFRRIWP